MGYFSGRWTLKSLTIGPQLHETNTQFWEEAFNDLPPLPRVEDVTIIYNYPTIDAFNTDCWKYFDRLLTRRDLFPALRSVLIQSTPGSPRRHHVRWWEIDNSLRTVRERGLKLVISK